MAAVTVMLFITILHIVFKVALKHENYIKNKVALKCENGGSQA